MQQLLYRCTCKGGGLTSECQADRVWVNNYVFYDKAKLNCLEFFLIPEFSELFLSLYLSIFKSILP